MSFIKIENLTHVYSKGTPFQKVAIDNINLEIDKGDFIGIIGHTGCGKSTLIRHMNGILTPSIGKIFIDDVDIFLDKKNRRDIRFKVGIVFQYPEYQLFEETIFKDIAFGPKNMGLSKEEIEKSVLKASEFVGISKDILDKSPFEISGGQKRRVAIAGVIAMNPEVLILDEPTAGLDPNGRKLILDRIKFYHEQTNNTVILVSHSMEDIAMYSKKILVMNDSKKYMYDKTENVFSMVDKLESIGLSIPQISKIFLKLKQKGIDVKTDILTINQAVEYILSILNRGEKC